MRERHHPVEVLLVGCGLVVAAAPMSGCTSPDDPADYLVARADAYRGGALWDAFWLVPGVKEPIEPGATATIDGQEVTSSLPADNPLYATNPAGNARTGSITWRCKECHGWDYKGVDGAYGTGSHRTDFAGVWSARSGDPSVLFAVIRDGGDLGEGHGFGAVLSDTDVADLVKFIREGLHDVDDLIGADGLALGEATEGQPLFDGNCASCHGRDGKELNFLAGEYDSEFVFNLAHDNPQEFVHKVRFGQPDGAMPNAAAKAYYLADVADILAHAQSLAPAGLELASAVRGGALWDVWWVVAEVAEPATTNPLYLDAQYNTLGGAQTGSITWRCKECHGWDYKGVDGAYATGGHATGIAGVFAAADLEPAQLIAIIGSGTFPDDRTLEGHAFAQDGMLTADDVADLALFIREGLVDDAEYISYASARSLGNPVAGQAKFDGNCATCHGKTGLRVNFAHDDPLDAEYVAEIARDNPFELAHKIRFGQPGSDEEAEEMEEEMGLVTGHMPNALDAAYSEADVADIVAWAAMLPGSIERGGLLWDTWWEAPHVMEPIEPGGIGIMEDGSEQPSSLPETNPQYVSNPMSNPRTGMDTWRCKECHGWDYQGVDGAYGSGDHATGFPGVFASRDLSAEELGAAIGEGMFPAGSDANHAFAEVLGMWAVTDLVKFIKSMQDYARELIYATGPDANTVKVVYVQYDVVLQPDGMMVRTRDADVLLGGLAFQGNCARCHGIDGRAINLAHDPMMEEEFLGGMSREDPWEVAHKILHGQPGSEPFMPNAAGFRYTLDDVADLLMYVQELP